MTLAVVHAQALFGFAGFTWTQRDAATCDGTREDDAKGILTRYPNGKFLFETIYPDGLVTMTRASSLEALLSAWYTPVELAKKMVAWYFGGREPGDVRVLEPSAGEGNLARALLAYGVKERNLTLIELNPARAARLELAFPDARVIQGDWLTIARNAKRRNLRADVVLGNPPYDGGLDTLHAVEVMNVVTDAGLLLPLTFLAGKERSEGFWQHVTLQRMIVLSTRPKHPLADHESESSGKRDSAVFDISRGAPRDGVHPVELEFWL